MWKRVFKELAEIMGRTRNSLVDKICNLGLKKSRTTVFSEDEEKIIIENYPTNGAAFFSDVMPDKSYNTIKSYCNRHGIYKKHNTERSASETE